MQTSVGPHDETYVSTLEKIPNARIVCTLTFFRTQEYGFRFLVTDFVVHKDFSHGHIKHGYTFLVPDKHSMFASIRCRTEHEKRLKTNK